MDKFKTFYNEKKGKYILFFGFYLIFFIFLAIYLRTVRANNPKEEVKPANEVVEKITTYDISNLTNNDYLYNIEILDNEEIITFTGKKSNVDYANYPNKYFLDIYNINQLLKRSKLINTENNVLTYELPNKEINDILLTNKPEAVNLINVYVNDKSEISKINLDLSKYMEKENYQIMIDYTVGDSNENSSS
jgi:hypothetical protein